VLPVGADQHAYAHHVAARLRAAGVPAGVDPHGPLGGRIRAAQSLRVPVVAVTGAREADAGAAALRRGADQRVVGLDEAVESLGAEVRERRR
jgi:threonyl-tRNA synthetase